MNLSQKVALNTAALVVGRVAVVGGGIVIVALSARHLGPGLYGALTVATALISILAALTDLGLYTIASAELAKRPEQARHILANVFTTGFAVSLVVAAAGLGVTALLYGSPDEAPVRTAVAVLLVQLLTAAPIGAMRAYFVSRQRAWLVAVAEAVNVVMALALTAVAVAADWGLLGLVAALGAGYTAQALVMLGLAGRGARLRLGFDLPYWRTLLALALPLGGTLIVNNLYFRLDVLLLSMFTADEVVGLYGLAYRVIEALIVLPSYLMITLFPEIARLDGASERLGDLMRGALGAMEILALPVLVLVVVFASEIVGLLAPGPAYAGAAAVLQILTVGLAVSYVNGVFGHALVALGRQARLFWLSLLVLGVNVALNLALIPPFGVRGAAAAVAVSELVAFLVVRRIYRGVAPLPTNPVRARALLAGVGLAAAAMAAKLVLGAAAGPLVVVLAGSALGLAAYAALLLVLRAVPEALTRQLRAPMLRAGGA